MYVRIVLLYMVINEFLLVKIINYDTFEPSRKIWLILLTNIIYKAPSFSLAYLQKKKKLRTLRKTEQFHKAPCTFITCYFEVVHRHVL